MEGGRKLEHMVRYSACTVVDIDDSPIPVPELLLRAAELPYVKAGHVSPSGSGVKLFVLVDSGLKDHYPAFEVVRRRVETDLPGVKVDISGKDPNRGCFASHDPDAFYKEESEVIEIPVASPELQSGFRASLRRHVLRHEAFELHRQVRTKQCFCSRQPPFLSCEVVFGLE